jgi:signal transduction histidine kinase/CheY-like chemotaxis protein
MNVPLITVRIAAEHDVVAARQRARDIAAALGFDVTGQTRLATAVSEIARNAFAYAGGGRVEFAIEGPAAPPPLLVVRVIDRGPGIARLAEVLGGRYRSATGMGLGIVGARRLTDHFDVASSPAGTTITLRKIVPRRTPVPPAEVGALVQSLASRDPASPLEEVRRQNQELLQALEELQARQQDIERINRELEDTNRGVVALYAELDERADHLRRADELKSRFLSNMTHEFRTPVNSILALARLLGERLDSQPDQKDELYYIRRSAQQLSELIDDLLDIAKVEAGKIEVHPAPFEVQSLFGALRGMLRPLLLSQSVNLVFEEPAGVPPVFSDESKVSQILRNFISNALKYTEQGEVRVCARYDAASQTVTFEVSDTGIGIAEADLPQIFNDFVQIQNPLQRKTKGTGLGLPLSKRLAELLDGTIEATSTLGQGSTFAVRLPLVHSSVRRQSSPARIDPARVPVLAVEDSDEDTLLLERALTGSRYQLIPARSLAAADAALAAMRPAAVLLDIRLHEQDSWSLLARLKRDDTTGRIPVIIVSQLTDTGKGFALGADAYGVKPIERTWLIETLDRLLASRRTPSLARVLTIDDEETSRFIIRGLLGDAPYDVIEASSGAEGLAAIADSAPDVVLLDYQLPDMTGLDVLRRVDRDGRPHPPVILVTSQGLSAEERGAMGSVPVLSKASLTAESLQSAIGAALTGAGVPETRP